MPISDSFPNLPGMVAQINDQGLQATASPQTLSQTVLLLGVATDGPINTPIAVSSVTSAISLFGTTTASTSVTGTNIIAKSLTARVYELLNAGCTDIRLCRVGGVSSTLTLNDASSGNALVLTNNYPGVKYNALTASTVAGSAGSVNITTLDGIVHPFPFIGGVTLYGDVMNTINTSNINVNASQVPGGNPLVPMTTIVTPSTVFAFGADGTNLSDVDYSNALTAAYRQLETYAVNVVVPAGAYLQPTTLLDSTGNVSATSPLSINSGDTVFYGQNLAQFCARMSVNTQSCYGVISLTPLLVPTFTNVINRGKQLIGTYNPVTSNVITVPTSYLFQYAADYSTAAITGQTKQVPIVGANNVFVDTGYLLQICAGPDDIVNSPNLGNYVADTAPSYAGLSVSLAPQSATTNKTVPNLLALSYNFGASVLNSLVGLRFVTFNVIGGTVRVVADQTYSQLGRDFKYLSTLRVTYAAMENVRSATQGFIGMGSNPANLNSMGTAINSALHGMKSAGALLDYSYWINASTNDQIAGNLKVTLILIPALQIRKIIVTISLQPGGALSVSSTS